MEVERTIITITAPAYEELTICSFLAKTQIAKVISAIFSTFGSLQRLAFPQSVTKESQYLDVSDLQKYVAGILKSILEDKLISRILFSGPVESAHV